MADKQKYWDVINGFHIIEAIKEWDASPDEFLTKYYKTKGQENVDNTFSFNKKDYPIKSIVRGASILADPKTYKPDAEASNPTTDTALKTLIKLGFCRVNLNEN